MSDRFLPPHRNARRATPPQRSVRPTLEALEDRVTPATTYYVTSFNDTGAGTLRYDAGLAQTGDTISFSGALNNQTI